MLDARGARRRSAILEHACHVLGSALGKIGQASQLGIMRRGRDRGRSGARGAGRCFCPGARGAGRWSAPPSAPANPVHGRSCRQASRSRLRRTPTWVRRWWAGPCPTGGPTMAGSAAPSLASARFFLVLAYTRQTAAAARRTHSRRRLLLLPLRALSPAPSAGVVRALLILPPPRPQFEL